MSLLVYLSGRILSLLGESNSKRQDTVFTKRSSLDDHAFEMVKVRRKSFQLVVGGSNPSARLEVKHQKRISSSPLEGPRASDQPSYSFVCIASHHA